MAGQSASMAVGAAIKKARGTVTQEEMAQRLGVHQSEVSRWERGEVAPRFEDVAAVEKVLGRPRGYVYVAAGLVEGVTTVEQAISMDSKLDPDAQRMLLASYRAALG